MNRRATLRGFAGHPVDFEDRVGFCHPLLSLSQDSVYLAEHLQWQEKPDRHLTLLDADALEEFGTLLPERGSELESGSGVVVVGAAFRRLLYEADLAYLGDLAFHDVPDLGVVYGVASPNEFRRYLRALSQGAVAAFDKQLQAITDGTLSDVGRAALEILRRVPLARDSASATRELVGALLERDFQLYERLVVHISRDLDEEESLVHWSALGHCAVAATTDHHELRWISPEAVVDVERHATLGAITNPFEQFRLRSEGRLQGRQLEHVVYEQGPTLGDERPFGPPVQDGWKSTGFSLLIRRHERERTKELFGIEIPADVTAVPPRSAPLPLKADVGPMADLIAKALKRSYSSGRHSDPWTALWRARARTSNIASKRLDFAEHVYE